MKKTIRARMRAMSATLAGSREARRIAGMAVLIATGATTLAYRPNAPVTKDMGTPTARPNPFAGEALYVDPNSRARKQAHEWRKSNPAAAAAMEKIAMQPQADWYNEWARDIRKAVDQRVTTVTRAGAVPVMVAYNIPNRDCGSYSAGGKSTAAAYRKWIREFASGLAGRKSVIILEPDALAGMGCLDAKDQEERVALIKDAVQQFKKQGAAVYIDAGHSSWIGAEQMAQRLKRAGIAEADGFALNISNFFRTAENIAYGERLSRLVGGKHMIIDTSRNGVGATADKQWCNPAGRALGANPTVRTGHALVDAFLWIKKPGESDGSCRGAPSSGKWWPEYALDLANRQTDAIAMATQR